MTDQATPAKVRLTTVLGPLSEAEVRSVWDKACRAVTVQGGGNDVQVFADYLQRPLLTEIERLRTLAEHLRHCRECGETDVANCGEGEPLWDACMPQPAAEIGGA